MEYFEYTDEEKINDLISSIRLADKKAFDRGDVTRISLFYEDDMPQTSTGSIESRKGDFEFEEVTKEGKNIMVLQTSSDDPYGFVDTDVCWLYMEFLESIDRDLFYSVLTEDDI